MKGFGRPIGMGKFSGPGGFVLWRDFFSRERIFFAFFTGLAGRGSPGISGTELSFLVASLAFASTFFSLAFAHRDGCEIGRVVVVPEEM